MAQVLPGIPRIYTALAEWLACTVFISTQTRRMQGWKLWLVLIASLLWQSVFLYATGTLAIIFWVPCMALAAAFMYLLLFLCCAVSLMDVSYYCIQAFLLAETAAALEWQLHCFLWPDGTPLGCAALGLLSASYGCVFLFAIFVLRRNALSHDWPSILPRELVTALTIGVGIFIASNIGFLSARTPLSGSAPADVYIIRTIIDLCGVAVLYAHYLQCRELRVRQELEAVRAVMRAQYQQYQLSKDTVELIDRKYHDLKHQIMVLRSEFNSERSNAYLNQMEEDIRVYEAQNKTQNPVLDTILTCKGLTCEKLHISLTCAAEGQLLDFMEVMDISSIFGNALDNAIECVCQIADVEKRLIQVTVSAKHNFIFIQVENYCESQLDFRDGLPITTKGNRELHGYGLKSIRFIAKKYGGSMTTKIEENWFVLRILLPFPSE